MRLWVRLVAAFLFVVLLLGATTVLTGSRLIDGTVRREAQHRTELDLRSARAEIDSRLARIESVVEHAARMPLVEQALADAPPQGAPYSLEEERRRYDLDALSVCNAEGRVVLRSRHPYESGGNLSRDPVVERALEGQANHGIVVLYRDELAREGTELPRQAFVSFVPTPRAKPRAEDSESSGMMLWAAAPVMADGRVQGAVYGGVLLNRNWELVDAIRDTVFGEETYEGKNVGTVTIFLWDVRVATNVKTERGNRAIGTRVSAEVYDRVLESGRRWYERAFVVNDWYISAYEPIRNPQDEIVGILYVGVLEAKYADLRDRILRTFLTPIGIAIVISVALSFLLARTIARPVRELVVASKRLADGDLDYRPPRARSSPELATLTDAYSQMADAIHQRDEELRRRNLELQASNEKLSQLNRNYMDMLGFVTHELKNPLNSVIFSAAALRDGYMGELNDKQRQSAERVVRNAKYLEEMIRNYLDLSRIEKGEVELNPQPIDLRTDVVEPMVAQLQPQLDEAGMHLDNQVPQGTRLVADPALLRIVVDNLLTNAAKYGREEGRVEIRCQDLDSQVRFSVWNEGQGIRPDDLPKLFGKFARLQQPATATRKGTGLGLFVSRDLVRRHGGEMWAESRHGEWAEFIVTLPKSPPAAEQQPPDDEA
ncbi:MAG: cache domain-containing protein [Candidatus Brocadiia bacterium]